MGHGPSTRHKGRRTICPSPTAVRSVPTLIVFKAGRVVDQRIGLPNRAELTRIVDAQLETPAGH